MQLERANSAKPLPLHRRLLQWPAVRYVRGVLANFFAMLVLSIMLVMYILPNSGFRLDDVLDNARTRAVESLSFVFPEYYVEIGNISLDFDTAHPGLVRVQDVLLTDTVEERYITIDEILMSLYLPSLLFGETKFNHFALNDVIVDYRLEAPEQNSRLVFPINFLDIPANLLTKAGDIEINNMILRLVNSEGKEIFSVKDLQGDLLRSDLGYEARISARQTQDDAGSLVFNIDRKNDEIIFGGFARNYKLADRSDFKLEFDLGLEFDGVEPYDFTETSENARLPFRFLEEGQGFVRLEGRDLIGEAQYVYDQAKDALSIKNMRLDIGAQSFKGNVDVTLEDAIYARGYDFGAEYEGVDGHVNFGGGSFFSRINLANQRIDIGEISFLNPYFHIYGQGAAFLQPVPAFAFDAKIGTLNYEDLRRLWPKEFSEVLYKIVTDRLGFDNIHDATLAVRYRDDLQIEADMMVDGLNIKGPKALPAIVSEEAQIRLTEKSFLLTAPSADFAGFEERMDFSDVEFWVNDFYERPLEGEMRFAAQGEVGALLESLSREPIALSKRLSVDPKEITGDFRANIDMHLPFKSQLKFRDIDLVSDATLNNVRAPNVFSGEDLRLDDAKLKLTQNDFSLSGDLNMFQTPAKLSIDAHRYNDPILDLALDLDLTPRMAKAFDINIPQQASFRALPTKAAVQVERSRAMNFEANVNLRDLAFNEPSLGLVKSRGSAGSLRANGRMANGAVEGVDFDLDTAALNAVGRWSPGSGIIIPALSLGDIFQGEIAFDGSKIIAKNAVIDLRAIDLGGGNRDNRNTTQIEFQNVDIKLFRDINALGVNGHLQTGVNTKGELTGRIGGQGPVRLVAWTKDRELHARVTSDRAGAVLRGANLFKDMRGGKMDLHLKSTDVKQMYAGKLIIDDYAVVNSSIAIQLLQAGSIFGPLEGDRLHFANLNADIIILPEQFNIYSGYTFGPSLGVSIGGTYNSGVHKADFFGTLTPAYIFNGAFQRVPIIGGLLGGNEGEGLFSVTYRMKGTPHKNLSITANPLSLLTPGKLRELWGNVPQAAALPEKYRVD